MRGQPFIKAVVADKKADAALLNEQTTRERVDALEQWAVQWSRMGLKRRLRWLFLGR
jgi:hypothetical protein